MVETLPKECNDCNMVFLTNPAYFNHTCNADSTNQRELYCSNCGAMKRIRGEAFRRHARCYKCNEFTVFEAQE